MFFSSKIEIKKEVFRHCINNDNSAGFTLIELMVVFVIMALIGIMMMVSYLESRPRMALERVTETFINDVYRAKERSVSQMFYEDNSDLVGGDHGILVIKNTNNYSIFVEKVEGEKIIEQIDIERGIFIEDILVSGEQKDEVRVLFSSRKVYFEGELPIEEDYVDIVFMSEDSEEIKRSVRITSSGEAEIIYTYE